MRRSQGNHLKARPEKETSSKEGGKGASQIEGNGVLEGGVQNSSVAKTPESKTIVCTFLSLFFSFVRMPYAKGLGEVHG
jgi:hypothetical protein